MTFSWDFNTATLIAIGVQVVIVIVYLVKTNGKATSAYELADKADKKADEAHEKLSIVQASLGLHREQVAKEYVDRDALREMEDRLMDALSELRKRVDKLIDE